jgi:2',3'-cyclic-nucleotide 2'-phosphodiesterase (5'-nucleotidase family)
MSRHNDLVHRRRVACQLLAALGLLGLLLGCAAPATPTATPTPTREPLRLTILHTNDTWGQTDPCG